MSQDSDPTTNRWGDIDWNADRPSESEIERSLDALRYVAVPYEGPATNALLQAIDRTLNCYECLMFARLQVVDDDETLRWFASRNRLAECGFLNHFLTSAGLKEALPELGAPAQLDKNLEPTGAESGIFGLDGELASLLYEGGAYQWEHGPAGDSKALATRGVEELIQGRYEDFILYESEAEWAAFFNGTPWDHTWLLVDKRYAQITVLCTTDYD